MKPSIVAYGDCQVLSMIGAAKRLPELTDRFDLHYIKAVQTGDPVLPRSPLADDVWRRCVAFWQQIGTTVPPPHYIADVPRTAKHLTFAALFMPFTFPFDDRDRVIRPTPESALFGYADQFLSQVAGQNLSGDAIYDKYEEMQEAAMLKIDRVLETGVRLMTDRDREANIPIAGYAIAHLADKRMAFTSLHPTGALSSEQLDRVLRATFPAETRPGRSLYGAGQRAFDQFEGLGGLSVPVSRTVARRLGLGWWREDFVYHNRINRIAMTTRQFAIAYVEIRRKRLAAARAAEASPAPTSDTAALAAS